MAGLPRIARWAVRAVLYVGAAVMLVIVVRAFDSRRLPELRPWHRHSLEGEFRAQDAAEVTTLDAYLALEERLFGGLAAELEAERPLEGATEYNRFNVRSRSHPSRFSRNWNRTREWRPEPIRGGVLLLHGLTDSPYSLRTLGESLASRGYYTLLMRHPGHGTHPGALVDVDYEDWLAAARIGGRHVRAEIGDDAPLLWIGYSMGGAVAFQLALESLENGAVPGPDKLLLLSPAMGVNPAGMIGSWHKLLSWHSYFERFRWLDVLPEYDPFKYNSFPKNAGRQMYRLTRRVHAGILRARKEGGLERFPETLAFQSVADRTVSTPAVLDSFRLALDSPRHQLVLFDLNRRAMGSGFLDPSLTSLVSGLTDSHRVDYRLTLVTNESENSNEVVETKLGPRGGSSPARALGLAWPAAVYSLSHVAIPFGRNDPMYGETQPEIAAANIGIGSWAPRGEKGLLAISMNDLMRLRFNPFLPYQMERIREWLEISKPE